MSSASVRSIFKGLRKCPIWLRKCPSLKSLSLFREKIVHFVPEKVEVWVPYIIKINHTGEDHTRPKRPGPFKPSICDIPLHCMEYMMIGDEALNR